MTSSEEMLKFPTPVFPSLESVPESSPARLIYKDNIYPNGEYVRFPYGRTRYWLLGPESGPKIVLIHGISTPAIAWMNIAPDLAARGFRVLVYDLYGKGYSEAPQISNDTNLFISQLAFLLQYVRWDSTYVAGFSMGGGIAAAFAATFPHLVANKLVLIASSGLSTPINERRIPAGHMERFQELQKLQGELLPGYNVGIKSCFENGPISRLEWAFDSIKNLIQKAEPLLVLLIHGTNDQTVPVQQSLKINERIPTAQLFKIEGGGHDMIYEDDYWKVVADAIAEFLK